MNTETLKLIIDLVSKLGGDAKLVLFTWLAIDIIKYLIISGAIALVFRWVSQLLCKLDHRENFTNAVMAAAGYSGYPTQRELGSITDYVKAGRAKDSPL